MMDERNGMRKPEPFVFFVNEKHSPGSLLRDREIARLIYSMGLFPEYFSLRYVADDFIAGTCGINVGTGEMRERCDLISAAQDNEGHGTRRRSWKTGKMGDV